MSYILAGTAIVGAGVGIYKTVKSSNAEKRDRAALETARKNRPEYVIPEAFTENRNIAGNMASQGLDSAAKDFYSTLATNGLTSSIGASQAAGGGVNSLQELLNNYNQDNQRLAVSDAQMKNQNIDRFINENSALAGQQLIKKFGIPNQRNQNDIASLNNSIYQDQAGVNAGLSDVTGAAASYVASRAGAQPRQQRQSNYVGDGLGYAPEGQQGVVSAFEPIPAPQQPPDSLGNLQPTYIPPQSQIPAFLRKPQPYQQPVSPWEPYNY